MLFRQTLRGCEILHKGIISFFDYLISKTKECFQYDKLNDEIKEIFHYDSIDILRGIPMIFQEKKTFPLYHLGQGIKTFIYNISSLLIEKNNVLFLDEMDNGIHYSHFDKLWEIILKVSKQQNVQVFATTHSKECIESFNRVQLKNKEKNKDTYYFEMIKNIKTDKVFMRKLDSNQLEYELTHKGEFRG